MSELHSIRTVAYRVECVHEPGSGAAVCWTANVYQGENGTDKIADFWGDSPESALERAQHWINAKSQPPLPAHTYYLRHDGAVVTGGQT